MGEVIQLPTLVRIDGHSSVIREFLTCKLLILGYDILVEPDTDIDAIFKSEQVKTVYKQQIKKVGFLHSRFVVSGTTVNIYINSIQQEINILRMDDGDIKTFVDFVIWCWGTARGNRCPYQNPILFSQVTRNEWQLF